MMGEHVSKGCCQTVNSALNSACDGHWNEGVILNYYKGAEGVEKWGQHEVVVVVRERED